jgi:hypothetical protein
MFETRPSSAPQHEAERCASTATCWIFCEADGRLAGVHKRGIAQGDGEIETEFFS